VCGSNETVVVLKNKILGVKNEQLFEQLDPLSNSTIVAHELPEQLFRLLASVVCFAAKINGLAH
jgi:hypothetical protein